MDCRAASSAAASAKEGADAGAGGRGGQASTAATLNAMRRSGKFAQLNGASPRGLSFPRPRQISQPQRSSSTLIVEPHHVHRATRDFEVSGKSTRRSYVVLTAQAFRPHVRYVRAADHPDNIPYPGATPHAALRSRGWTLAVSDGRQFEPHT